MRDLVTTAAAKKQCSLHAVGRWRTQLERVLLSQADTYMRALGSRGSAGRPTSAAPLLEAGWSVCFSFISGYAVTRLICEVTSDRDRDSEKRERRESAREREERERVVWRAPVAPTLCIKPLFCF